MDERERIRQEKLRKLKEQAQQRDQSADETANQSKERKIEELFKQATTSEARQRLNTVEMAKPELAAEVKRQIAQVQAAGKLAEVIDDARMKDLLADAHDQASTSFDISRR